jgi:hypothetical protein
MELRNANTIPSVGKPKGRRSLQLSKPLEKRKKKLFACAGN